MAIQEPKNTPLHLQTASRTKLKSLLLAAVEELRQGIERGDIDGILGLALSRDGETFRPLLILRPHQTVPAVRALTRIVHDTLNHTFPDAARLLPKS